MIGWLVRGLLILAGLITGWFVARDALKFQVIQMFVAVFLVTFFVALITFWPMLKNWFKNRRKRDIKF